MQLYGSVPVVITRIILDHCHTRVTQLNYRTSFQFSVYTKIRNHWTPDRTWDQGRNLTLNRRLDHHCLHQAQYPPNVLTIPGTSNLLNQYNSIRGKKLELQSFLETSGFDVVAIQETKIDSSVSNAELFPPELGYSIFRKDRVMGGGGVLLAVKSDLNPSPCLILISRPRRAFG